jgi:hypothetical protein
MKRLGWRSQSIRGDNGKIQRGYIKIDRFKTGLNTKGLTPEEQEKEVWEN